MLGDLPCRNGVHLEFRPVRLAGFSSRNGSDAEKRCPAQSPSAARSLSKLEGLSNRRSKLKVRSPQMGAEK
jgi:hypothetical protein